MKGIKIIRLFGAILGSLCLFWFFAPFMMANILNIGNITGIIGSALLLSYCVFMPRIHGLIRNCWKAKGGKLFITAVAGIGAICMTVVLVVTFFMEFSCHKRGTVASTAVVLGCRVYGERPSLSMIERLEAAYEYLIEHPEAACVVSGGQGPGEDISEAECMYRWLVEKGIEPSRIYKEDKSTSTEENIEYSMKVIEENGLFQKIVIVTNEYHICRAGMIAKDYGQTWGAKPAKTVWWLFPTYYVREIYAIVAEFIWE